MRVVAGRLRHRIIKMTNLETTRETQDRIREAIFNSLGPIYGSGLDLFCGSGAMAIEAYSRGLDYVVINDLNIKALEVAKENFKSLGIKNYEAYNFNYIDFLNKYLKPFDYIFLDPPYAFVNVCEILDQILNSKVVKNKTKIIFEMASITKYTLPKDITLIKEKVYGKKKVVFMEVDYE